MEKMTTNKEYYESLFVKEYEDYIDNNNQKIRIMKIRSSNKQFQKYIEYLSGRYASSMTYGEVVSEVMYQAWLVIKDFKFKNPMNNWEEMICESSQAKDDLAMMFSSIKKRIDNNLMLIVQDVKEITVNNEKRYLENDMASLDAVLIDNDDSFTLLDTITTGYWDIAGQAYGNPFLTWFRENRESILTATQNEFLDKINQIDASEGFTSAAVAQQMEMDSSNIAKIINRIQQRVLKAYEESKDEKFMKPLDTLAQLVDEDSITIWFQHNIKLFRPILKDQEFYKELHATLRKKEPDTDIVWLADRYLLQYLNKMKRLHRLGKPFYKKEWEMSGFDHVQAQKNYRELCRNSDVKVYDKEGNLIRTEKNEDRLPSASSKKIKLGE